MLKVQNIALLTSGGDSPGMNACIRAVVRSCVFHGIQAWGVIDGFNGLLRDDMKRMNYDSVSFILEKGGTILGTARCKEFLDPDQRKKAYENLKRRNIDAVIAIGGDGTFKGIAKLSDETGIPVVGIPGTIDNDIFGTDYTIGFDTALNTVMRAVDNIRDTASSHHRIFLVEVMGNNSGQIALHTAVVSGSEEVFMPEKQEDLPEIKEKIGRAIKANKSSVIIVAEGDQIGGAKELYQYLADEGLAEKIRVSVLGHIQRGGSPTYLDRMNATRFGEKAVVLLLQGKSNLMVGIQNGELAAVDLALAWEKAPPKNMDYLNLVRKLSVY